MVATSLTFFGLILFLLVSGFKCYPLTDIFDNLCEVVIRLKSVILLYFIRFIMGILEKIADIEHEIARTQKNKGVLYLSA